MIEGGAVDKSAHVNHTGRTIEEMVDFNATVRAVEEWVNQYSSWRETLVIVTSDHETGMLWGLNSDREPFDPIISRGPWKTPGMQFNSGNHTNSLVPLRARGAGASLFESRILGYDPVFGRYVDNTSVFEVMRAAMGAQLPSDHFDRGYSRGWQNGRGSENSSKSSKLNNMDEMLKDD